MLEFAYNDSVNPSTGYTPFFLNHGRHPHMPTNLTCNFIPSSNPAANEYVSKVAKTITSARARIAEAQERQARHADRSRRAHAFAVGDRVLLIATSFALPKLGPRYLGPFEVTELVGPVAIRLRLPPSLSRRADVFHPEKLRPFVESANFQRPSVTTTVSLEPTVSPTFNVAKILEKKKVGRGFKMLVAWEGYPDSSDNTWEPVSRLRQDVPQLVADFEAATD